MEIIELSGDTPVAFFQDIATIHASELSPGILAELGPSFLTLFYRHIAADRDSDLFVAVEHDQVLGFVAGTVDTAQFYRRLGLRHLLSVGLYLAPYIVRPSVIRKIQVRLQNLGSKSMTNLPQAELLSIALQPSSKGKGVGHKLVAALQENFHRRGIRRFKVSTAEARDAAQRLYVDLDCRLVASVPQGNLTAFIYVCPTSPAGPPNEPP